MRARTAALAAGVRGAGSVVRGEGVGHFAAYARVGVVAVEEADGFLAWMVVVGEGVEHLREYLAVRFLNRPGGQEFARLLFEVRAGVEEPPHPQVIHHEPAMRRVTGRGDGPPRPTRSQGCGAA